METEDYLKTIRFHFDTHDYQKAECLASRSLGSLNPGTREYLIANSMHKLCGYVVGKYKTVNLEKNLETLKEMGYSLDWAYLKRMEFEALFEKNADDVILSMADELTNVEEIFKDSNIDDELARISSIKAQILNVITCRNASRAISMDYMQIFYEVGDVMSKYVNDDDFFEKILSILITVTNSERGVLFLIEGSELRLAAGLSVDQKTVNDARKLSRSVVKETGKKSEIICCADALIDPRFKKSKSVMLNKIRSVICAPVRVKESTIGAIYLYSRFKCNLFSEEDQHFLRTLTYLIASIVERSKIFLKTREKALFLESGKLADAASEYLIGESPAIEDIRDVIERIAATDSTVLLTGETGTGKGVIARLIHHKSKRMQGKFIAFSCGAVPETLLESELFGHKTGAFTGAINDRRGLFEEAEGGTLFLDDVSNAPLTIQAKLLQAIEEKTIRRLGESTERKVNVRIISATNQGLQKLVKQGFFREDLYYRIGVIPINIPPLRERTADIPIFADFFLKKYATKMKHLPIGFDKNAMKKMLSYAWPGNVRELQNAIERAVGLTAGRYISADDLKLNISSEGEKKPYAKETLMSILNATKWNISAAARFLGIARLTLYRYLKKYSLHHKK